MINSKILFWISLEIVNEMINELKSFFWIDEIEYYHSLLQSWYRSILLRKPGDYYHFSHPRLLHAILGLNYCSPVLALACRKYRKQLNVHGCYQAVDPKHKIESAFGASWLREYGETPTNTEFFNASVDDGVVRTGKQRIVLFRILSGSERNQPQQT